MNIPFTAQERRSFLDQYFKDLQEEYELDFELEEQDGTSDKIDKLDELRKKNSDARDEYRLSVPIIPMARCPFTGQVVYHSVDPYGLDGLWWDYMSVIRPVETLPSTFMMLTGSLKLGKIEKTPFTVYPGPEVPYVLPEVLMRPEVKAVITQAKVGDHIGYPIFYFSETRTIEVEPVNKWASNHWTFVDGNGTFLYHEYGMMPEDPEDFGENDPVEPDDPEEPDYTNDFEIAKWVEQGKLLWIEPNDNVFTLKSGTAGCPYLNITGSRAFSVIYDGEQEEEEN